MALPDRVPESGFEPRIGRSVSIDHAAELLGVSRRTVYNRIRDGRLHTVRTLGGSQRVTLESVISQGGRRPESSADKDARGAAATALVTIFLLLASLQPAEAQRLASLSAGSRR